MKTLTRNQVRQRINRILEKDGECLRFFGKQHGYGRVNPERNWLVSVNLMELEDWAEKYQVIQDGERMEGIMAFDLDIVK